MNHKLVLGIAGFYWYLEWPLLSSFGVSVGMFFGLMSVSMSGLHVHKSSKPFSMHC